MRIQTLWACLFALFLPLAGWAAPLAITPPLSDGTVTGTEQGALQEALAAGLRDLPDTDEVNVVLSPPPDLTAACLDDPRCLERVMIYSEAPGLVAGRASKSAETYKLDLVYFARGMVVRRQQFTVPTSGSGLAVAARALAYELITGESAPPEVLAAASAPSRAPKPAKEPKPAREPRPKKTKEPRVREPKVAKAPRERPERPARTVAAPRPPRSAAAAPKPPRVAGSSSAEDLPRLRMAGRLGWSKYYVFDFVTVGVEAGARVVGGLYAVAGAEVYAVNRDVPSAVDPEGGTAWNAMVPWNVGVLYATELGPLRPYAGADLIFVKYNRDASGLATGGRGRLGADFMLSDRVGLNLNVALGAWSGSTWERVDDDLKSSGFLPQISGGTVIAF